MSRAVNIVFDDKKQLIWIEDATTAETVNVGHWMDMEDGYCALQIRIVGFHEHDGEAEICPCCMQKIPPPPVDLTWRRSKP